MSDPISNATGIQNCLRGRREPKNRSEAPTRLKPLVAKVPVPAPILNRTAPTTNRYARIPDRLASISTSERVIVTGRSQWRQGRAEDQNGPTRKGSQLSCPRSGYLVLGTRPGGRPIYISSTRNSGS